ncbi:MAG: hypothetical protein M1836_006553 [Candelina mexicana]|nr:MAG: hypothetical protein M1836_006553 [Candelina mexicana]
MAAYRSIRPSQQDRDSASGPASQSTGMDSTTGGLGESSSGGGANAGKRRRAPKSVTQNACTNCKKARAKCDGKRPACSRCTSRDQGESCVYELHVKTAKEQMVREIKDLKEKNTWIEQILAVLVSNGHGSEVIQRLRNGESYRAIAQSLGAETENMSLSPTAEQNLSEALMDYDLDSAGSAGDRDSESGLIHGRDWTRVTSNESLVDHLVALYFTWVHPLHMIFSENHFMASYGTKSNLYCSPALVNAICAMGCHVYDPEGDEGTELEMDPLVLGEKFMDEARSLIRPEIYHRMATIQTFAIMFMVDLASGKGSRASTYIRLAAENLNARLEIQYCTEALEIAKWGIYSMNVGWSSVTCQIPNISGMPSNHVFDNVRMDMHDQLWRFYRRTGDFSGPERSSSAMQTAAEFAKLSLLMHEHINYYYDSHGTKFTARKILEQYENYLSWREALPEELADVSSEGQALPHVLSLHIRYFAALVVLFRPLLAIKKLSTGTRRHIEDVTIENAQFGVELLKIYRTQYSCRYQPALQNFSLLHLCDILVRYGPAPTNTEAVSFCLEVLKEAADDRGGFAVCGPLQETFRQTAIECGVPLPDNIRELMGPADYGFDDILDACTRHTYAQPVDQIVENVCATFDEDFSEEWRKLIENRSSQEMRVNTDTGRYMQIDSLLNDGPN